MIRRRWIERSVRGCVVVIAVVLLGGAASAMPVLAQESEKFIGFVMDIDKRAAALECERKGGAFVTLHLDKGTRWVLKKVDLGDRVDAVVMRQDGRLVAKEITLHIGPFAQVDIVQGVVSKVDHRSGAIEVDTLLGTHALLYLDENTMRRLPILRVGDGIEARVETVIEKSGPKQYVRVMVIGKGQ